MLGTYVRRAALRTGRTQQCVHINIAHDGSDSDDAEQSTVEQGVAEHGVAEQDTQAATGGTSTPRRHGRKFRIVHSRKTELKNKKKIEKIQRKQERASARMDQLQRIRYMVPRCMRFKVDICTQPYWSAFFIVIAEVWYTTWIKTTIMALFAVLAGMLALLAPLPSWAVAFFVGFGTHCATKVLGLTNNLKSLISLALSDRHDLPADAINILQSSAEWSMCLSLMRLQLKEFRRAAGIAGEHQRRTPTPDQ